MKALLVEDDVIIRQIISSSLEAIGIEGIVCESAEEALTLLDYSLTPLIILDVQLPGISGIELCQTIRNLPNGKYFFILVCTSEADPQILKSILAAGANDFLPKPFTKPRLDLRLAIAEQQVHTLAREKSAKDELAYLASHDPVTGLLNRYALDDWLIRATDMVRQGTACSLLYIDLDNFKLVNDTLGHSSGDKVLVHMVRVLQMLSRPNDQIFRFGGDEFVVLMEGADIQEATAAAETIRFGIEGLFHEESTNRFNLSVSIGVARFEEGMSGAEVVSHADEACFNAKNMGRNRVGLYQPNNDMLLRLKNDHNWVSVIRNAIRNDLFELYLQPVADMVTCETYFHEALLRLKNDQGDIIEPGQFLPAAERFGLMSEIDHHVMGKAAELLELNVCQTISVNVSGQSFNEGTVLEKVAQTFLKRGIAPHRVIFEITESQYITDLLNTNAMVGQLRSRGFRFALDDFGYGYCSFGYLKNMAVDIIKIDGSLIRDLSTNKVNQTLIKAIHEIAHLLEMQTVAEKVDTMMSYIVLAQIGVDFVQGFHVGHPSAASTLMSPPAQQ